MCAKRLGERLGKNSVFYKGNFIEVMTHGAFGVLRE
jgi:hypothetical protein